MHAQLISLHHTLTFFRLSSVSIECPLPTLLSSVLLLLLAGWKNGSLKWLLISWLRREAWGCLFTKRFCEAKSVESQITTNKASKLQ